MKFLSILLLILSLCSQVGAIPNLDWRSPNPDTKIELKNSILTVASTASAGGIYNSRPLNISDEDRDLLVIKMRTSSGGIGEVSWRPGGANFSFKRSLPFYLMKPGSYHTYYLNLAAYNRDHALIDHLLFFPLPGPGTAEIKELKFVKGDLWEKTLAGWQEFFGPAGREPDGFNFLVIRSPRLFGRPFLLYVNIFLLGFLIIAVAFRLRRAFLLTLLIVWIMLEMSTLLNNWIAFQRDKVYFGKSLEEKREMINTKGFYDFMKYADRELPAGAGFDIRAAGIYNDLRAQYYLYPRIRYAGAPYLLTFNCKIDRKLLEKYKPWKEHIYKNVDLP